MKMRILIPSLAALGMMAVPAMAQGVYAPAYHNGAPILGSQMTDRPSERANVTMTGSLLRPEMRDGQRVYIYGHPYRVYRDYDGDGR